MKETNSLYWRTSATQQPGCFSWFWPLITGKIHLFPFSPATYKDLSLPFLTPPDMQDITFYKICMFLVSGRQSEEDRRFLVLLSPLRDRQEWFPVLLLLLHLLTEKIKSRIVQEERKPLGISLHLSLLCQFLPPPSLSCLILSGWTFPGSYILFYHSLRPSPSPVLSFSLILFALTLQEFLSLFISTLSFFLCFLIWSLSFTAQVQAHQCCCVAQNTFHSELNQTCGVETSGYERINGFQMHTCIYLFIYLFQRWFKQS